MSTKPKDGGPAFPISDQANRNGDVQPGAPGMSLRDWFAGQAIVGLLGRVSFNHQQVAFPARLAYELADAMLSERAKPHTDEFMRDLKEGNLPKMDFIKEEQP